MDEQEEVQILDDPPLFIKLPHRSFSRNETIELLSSVVQTARITWEEERKLAIETAQEQANMARSLGSRRASKVSRDRDSS